MWQAPPSPCARTLIQTVVEARVDCDQDAVWLKVTAQGDGGACHTGARSCFYRVIEGGALRRTE